MGKLREKLGPAAPIRSTVPASLQFLKTLVVEIA
jgi:hypothetical protein